MTPGNCIVLTGSHSSILTTPFAAAPSCCLTAAAARPGQPAAEHLGIQAQLLHGAQEPDRVGRVGGEIDQIGLSRLHRADDRREIDRVRRIGAVVDDVEPGCLAVIAGAVGGLALELGVGADDRQPSSASGSAPSPARNIPRRMSLPGPGRTPASRSISDNGTSRWRPARTGRRTAGCSGSRPASPARRDWCRSSTPADRPCRSRSASYRCPAPATGCSGRRNRRA